MADLSAIWDRFSEALDNVSLGTGRALQGMFGSRNRRVVEKLQPIVARIAELEPATQRLTDDDLKRKTVEFREKLDQGATLDDLLIEAYACVREAARRALGLRHYDVQMIGGIVLHRGSIAEMATGEGKTLVATSPAYLNALPKKGVYVVTVNDYLAKRDRDWMLPVYQALGLNVGAIQSDMKVSGQRQLEYACDITYGTNNEFGFDYLRDNMKSSAADQVQKHLYYAIIDEVDSILIDEARTPLIISGLPDVSTDMYYRADRIARQLTPDVHFEVKEREHQCVFTEEGIERAQQLAGVDSFYTGANMDWPHHLEQALRAHHLYRRDKEYVVKPDEDGQLGIIIVDEFTGRLMPGRRWSDGLHQAIEAKEGLRIREETQTLATITFQNYFRLYEKIAGMTGTAMTEAGEFLKIYDLDVVAIPPNRPNIRKDQEDVVYLTADEKYASIIREIVEIHEQGRPALVGTVSIESSEKVSSLLTDPRGMTMWLARRCETAGATLDELERKKPSWLPPERCAEIRALIAKPAFLDVAKAEALADVLAEAAPKEVLSWLLGEIARYGRVVEAVKQGIPHNVLNAKQHEREAHIVAQAGRKGAVTIATNMAGRGTDIVLGGNAVEMAKVEVGKDAAPEELSQAIERFKAQCNAEKAEVIAAGGLAIVGTERHEARRIDNQLRGRCARQGDPGSTRFYLSLHDDLMRIFARDWVTAMLKRLGMIEGQEIESGMVTRGIERAQKKVEQRNFEIRKNLLEYDEVMDKQRKTIYALRQEVLEGIELKERVIEMCTSVVDRAMDVYLGEAKGNWEVDEFATRLNRQFGTDFKASEFAARDRGEVREDVRKRVTDAYEAREGEITSTEMRRIEKFVLLNVIDSKWKDHLRAMTQLREQVGLRSYAQVDPKAEYKREGFENFQRLMAGVEDEVTGVIFRIQVIKEDDRRKLDTRWQQRGGGRPPAAGAPVPANPPGPRAPQGAVAVPGAAAGDSPARDMARDQQRRESAARNAGRSRKPRTIRRTEPRVGRNDDCPCGSGRKYKKCCFPKFE